MEQVVNRSHVIQELQELLNRNIAVEDFPYRKGNSIRIGKYAIRKKQKENKKCILGLATGSSPISVYQELVRMHKEEGLSFSNVISFNLDEYFPMNKLDFSREKWIIKYHLGHPRCKNILTGFTWNSSR